ncbi:unnamed protein product [Musa textilis]
MAEEKPTSKPVLQKPPGYRDPAAAAPATPRPPPRRQPLPPAFRQPGKPLPRQRYRRSRRCSCCRICYWASAVALVAAAILAVVAGLAYLWFQPRLPSFRLESLNATQLRVAVRPDGTFLDVVTKVGILASNPNGRIVVEYGDGRRGCRWRMTTATWLLGKRRSRGSSRGGGIGRWCGSRRRRRGWRWTRWPGRGSGRGSGARKCGSWWK